MSLKIFETKTIDRLFLELRQFSKARTPDELKFDELIDAVESKFQGEERFDTALRYIRQAERMRALKKKDVLSLLSVNDLRNHPLFEVAVEEELREKELRNRRSAADLALALRAIDLQTMADR